MPLRLKSLVLFLTLPTPADRAKDECSGKFGQGSATKNAADRIVPVLLDWLLAVRHARYQYLLRAESLPLGRKRRMPHRGLLPLAASLTE